MNDPTKTNVLGAVQQLANSQKGLNALRHLLAWFDEDALALDGQNRRAVIIILRGAWGGFSGSACDLIREYLQNELTEGT